MATFDVNQFIKQRQTAGTVTKPAASFDVNQFIQSRQTNQPITPKISPVKAAPFELKTSQGLQNVATRAGVGPQAGAIKASVGEDPSKIYSGGMLSDIGDTLNLLQYGTVGVLKGKGFVKGVQTRESWSNNDAMGQYGLPGLIGGIALDIASDPLTYLGGFGILKRGVTALTKLGAVQKTSKVISETRVGKTLGNAFIYRFGQDPLYKLMDERRIKNVSVGAQNLLDIARPLTSLDSATQKTITVARKAGQLESLPADVLAKAKPAFDALDKLGKEAVDVGLLSAETYEKNVGKYIARLYTSKELPTEASKLKGVFDSKPLRVGLDRFKARKDIPEDIRQAMGEILEAGYPTAKSLVQLKSAVENAKFFNGVAGKFAKGAVETGFTKLPDVAGLGALKGKAVPDAIAASINEIIRAKSPTEKMLGKVVSGFKFGKVVMNPATHGRNIASNFLLNDFEGLSPARLDIYAKAAKELATQGAMYKEAKAVGLGLDTYAVNELKDILVGQKGNILRKSAQKLSDIYQKEEEFAKMAQFIFQRGKGLSPEDAMKVAERATFNYAQVTPFIRRLRESVFGYPFITFTYKATPQIAKTLVQNPQKISKYFKIARGIEGQSNPQELAVEKASEPSWTKDGFYVKLPIKDKLNRSAYLDLSYIMPFGDLVSGQFIQRGVQKETGLPEGVPSALVNKTPFANLLVELAQNKDFYGNSIFKNSDSTDVQLGDVFRHIMKTYLPPMVADQIPGGYRADGTRRPGTIQRIAQPPNLEAGGSQTRTPMEELLRNVGIKINPVDLETQQNFSERQLKTALETLLQEQGVTKKFEKTFIPK